MRISDESVTRATVGQVKQENPYMLFYELMPSWRQEEGKVEMPEGEADYATLQKAVAGAMSLSGQNQGAKMAGGEAASWRGSSAPSSLRIRPRTVHRWSTPPVA